MTEKPIRIGVSSCLLGEEVRHDGGHKRDRFVTDQLACFVDYVPTCPEMAIGLGLPRETIRLEQQEDGSLRLVAPRSGKDHTEAMNHWAAAKAVEIQAQELSGYIFKKDSPSCGLHRVKTYKAGHPARRDGRGLFAAALTHHMPLLPVEDEGRLHDAKIRENFIERVFAYARLNRFFQSSWSQGDLGAFHSREKLLLMAHDPKSYSALGRLVADGKGADKPALADAYKALFMAAMEKRATPGRHTNALTHMAGYVKKQMEAGERQEVAAIIEEYRQGLTPLIAPMTLLRHLVRRFDVAYLKDQTYLNPHPKELMLRNHV